MVKPGNFVSYQSSLVHYAVAGNGPVPLLVFPGYGQDYSFFESWAEPLGERYTLYLFDLFYHGRSVWREQRPLEKSDWSEIMSRFLQQEKIQRFAVAGYSLGGKFALATTEAFPDRLLTLFLLAPDGIRLNPWYRFATGTFLLRAFLKSMILAPGNFNVITRLMKRTGLVHGGILRFAESQMNTEEKRNLVYHTWVYFRRLRFDVKKISATLNKKPTPVLFVMGRFDKIIPQNRIAKFASLLNTKEIVLLDAGHNDIVSGAPRYLQVPPL